MALDTIDNEMQVRVKQERLLHSAVHPESVEATDYEVALYCQSASLVAPLSGTFFNIYMYAFSKCFPNALSDVGIQEHEKTLDNYEQGEFSRFKKWLYAKSMEALKAKMKEQSASPMQKVLAIPMTQFIPQ